MINWKPEGRKKRCRPRRTWKDGIYTELSERDLGLERWDIYSIEWKRPENGKMGYIQH